jgi:ABC-type branched-subunit amino acid transport system ATPase component
VTNAAPSSERSAPLLEVRNVCKSFGGVVANRDISLDVPAGEITGLIGPNGSGKTTLFNSIAGQHPVDAGAIRFDGRDVSRLRTPQIGTPCRDALHAALRGITGTCRATAKPGPFCRGSSP